MSASVLFPDEKTIRRRKMVLTISLCLAVVTSVAAVSWRWTNGVDAQNHAVRVMFSVVTDYMKRAEGDWPSGWVDLESLPSRGDWYEPVDYTLIKREVEIDFTVDLQVLAGQSPAEFNAIRAKNPVFDFSRDPRLVGLLATVREYHPADSQPAETTSVR